MEMEETKKSRAWLWAGVSGALMGVLFASWVSPGAIAWYFEPPVEIGVSCKAAIESALRRFQWCQFAGVLGGAASGFALFAVIKKKS